MVKQSMVNRYFYVRSVALDLVTDTGPLTGTNSYSKIMYLGNKPSNSWHLSMIRLLKPLENISITITRHNLVILVLKQLLSVWIAVSSAEVMGLSWFVARD